VRDLESEGEEPRRGRGDEGGGVEAIEEGEGETRASLGVTHNLGVRA